MNHHASMNRIYRLIWSEIRSAWVPVAETARARGKPGRARSIANRNVLAAAISLALAPLAHASPAPPCVAPVCGLTVLSATSHPLGGKVVSGTASITQIGSTTDIDQSSANLAIDWLSFNLGSQETVDFIQPSASAVAVNRISSTNGSEILGHLDANGHVYLINPNGIVFGKGAVVNVGGLVASTLDASDSNLSASTQSFAGEGTGSVVNAGTITAANGGYVVLLGNRVSNQGVISAQLGTVALGAGSAVTLDFSGNRLVHLQVDQSTLNNLAENKQLIQADGGLVIMTAGAQRVLLASVVNNTGIIEARTVENHDGTIELLGGMTAGTVKVGGTLDASAPTGGNGGFIETNGEHVEVADGTQVTTAASKGLTGTWLIDPTDFTIAPSGGDITGATLSSDLNSTNFTILSSTGTSPVTGGGSGGNINVNDTVSWSANTSLTLTAANNVNVNGSITASGAAAVLAINPNTTNGSETASGTGTLNLGADVSITLSGASASLSIAASSYTLGAGATINLANVSPTSTTALIIGGTSYTVINSLGAAGSTTGTDLQGINGNLSGHYALGSNINAAATATWNSNGAAPPVFAGFTPIGNSTTKFTGTFDGLGHSISNLSINRPTTNDIGLFGYSSGSAIRNVGLIGDSVSGSFYVGGLVGYNDGTVSNTYATGSVTGSNYVGGLAGGNFLAISNSFVTGSVSGTNAVGGLVGVNVGSGGNYGVVSKSYATGTVTALGVFVGGLVGGNYGGTISNNYATGKVSGSFYGIGGLVGFNGLGGAVNNSYATGSVSGANSSRQVGGLVGYNYSASTISNSYATGKVSGSSYVGGLVGDNFSGSTISNSFWDIATTGQSTSSGGGTGILTTALMHTASSFTGFTFSTTPGASGNNWVIVDSNGTLNNAGGAAGATFPLLLSFMAPLTVTANNATTMYNGSAYSGGNGVTYSVTPNANLLGTVSYSGTSQGAVNAGNYVITPGGLSSTSQQGYIISYANGTLTVDPADLIVTGETVSNKIYDGTTVATLTGGTLSGVVSGDSVTLAQSGSFTSKNAGNGIAVTASDTIGGASAGNYILTEPTGLSANITQLASVAWVGGATGNWSTASNWAGGAIPDLSNVAAVTIPKATTVTYDAGVVGTTILSTLTDSGKLVMAAGDLSVTGNLSAAGYQQTGGTLDVGGTLSITAKTGAVTLGDIDAAALSITASKGAIKQLSGTAVEVSGATSLTAEDGTSELDTITLAQAGDSFGGTVTAEGSAITLKDTTALTAVVDSSGATSLTAAGALNVSGTVGTTLTTKTTGKNHATTFGATTVGTSLNVTSTGAVTETSSNILTVDGAGTTTAPNPNVCVNGKCDVEIPAP